MPQSDRTLLVVLGDQLSDRLKAFSGFDAVWMAEVAGESTHVWSSKVRTALFLSAMRHFAAQLQERRTALHYRKLGEGPQVESLEEALGTFLERNDFGKVKLTRPGDYRVLESLKSACRACNVELEIVEDDSFYSSPKDFQQHAAGRKQLRMEYFYREMRKKHDVLMNDGEPAAGKWNFDASNRKSFGKDGPERLFPRKRFSPDEITKEVIQEVDTRFDGHPGNLKHFDWPVTRSEALEALDRFIESELPQFGTYQDAMWTGEPYLSHSLLASSINLKLIDAKEVVDAAEKAYRDGKVPIESAEGFIRQIIGWREYVRGIYWMHMPDYVDRNALEAKEPLPQFYWDGRTEMNCIREVVTQTMEHGYAHHIQRLMVTGLYALLHGVDPKELHEWYLAVYVDAVEWVELPNTLGMSQYADGGVMASKPYVATGKYIKRMSNYCDGCRFNPDNRTGEEACPFTVLYWDFLNRHQGSLKGNPRMGMQLRNLERVSGEELDAISKRADSIRAKHR
ncbi:cryptochrome/photolyase family protein [Pelagicoccus sp. SDUM812005]|uniref:cryptochrome/photolyase family protein n=1 Tax=Pelagicoccus sp. SDUM812005 TaxID=3041257 RepID=UPI00280D7F76|nr:cryptochrome/photolyase family protein [Pelagicoccus sp. SDUM812005]MDQ8183623.1 cryptochrome/photolyase family protein [Pelagicoccus sp. SDUM812005]